MKALRIISAGLLIASVMLALTGFASSVSASADKVLVCHWDNGQGGKYTYNEVSISSVKSKADWDGNGHGNHIKHPNDVYPSFIAKNGDVIPAYGNQSVLENKCGTKKPTEVVTTVAPTETEEPTDEPTEIVTTVAPTDEPTEIVTTVAPTDEPQETETPSPTKIHPLPKPSGTPESIMPITGANENSGYLFSGSAFLAGLGLVLRSISKRMI